MKSPKKYVYQSEHITYGKISHLQDFHNLMTSERTTDQKMTFSRKRVLATSLIRDETAEFIEDTKNITLVIEKTIIKKSFLRIWVLRSTYERLKLS